ncbi:hypothetical protein OG439_44580 [Amycolatopsis sp. NBC_01307]|uniref:hypothetical protein n=1 Tax=Amycolatopsis sp. NBC_01307 TaxID=2903561 RepID=UPI002E147085|nr:hypothetical protein OG439_44580 [Amycolatopsis sp. NBC_01307]
MDVVAQQVRTTWTTRSRGGAAASRRNRVPTVFPLPDHAGGQVHRVDVDESTGFEPRFAVRPIDELAGITLRERDGVLEVQVAAAPMGWPRREWRPMVRLEPGEWLRWQINHRFGATCMCGSEWSYRLETLSLAYGGVPDFTGTPTRTVAELGDLR